MCIRTNKLGVRLCSRTKQKTWATNAIAWFSDNKKEGYFTAEASAFLI